MHTCKLLFSLRWLTVVCIAICLVMTAPLVRAANVELLNVSYDPTRELFQEVNQAFQIQWRVRTNQDVIVRQSHGGSGKQARAVIDGLEADVVTLALAYDIDAIAREAKLLPADWQAALPDNSCPYTSTIVFLVRKGNPKKIKDWNDLARNGVSVITPNPKTSGGARWNYLAAWGYARKRGGDDKAAMDFVARIYRNVPVLDTGARGSTNTFRQGLGDVLISWENEALLALQQSNNNSFEIVVPSLSIRAEPPVAIVAKNAEKHGTAKIAQAYIEFMYSRQGQEICARHFYRPTLKEVEDKYRSQFPSVKMFKIEEMFKDWSTAQAVHFSDGGTFDKIYAPN